MIQIVRINNMLYGMIVSLAVYELVGLWRG